jgi:hypothetical protein
MIVNVRRHMGKGCDIRLRMVAIVNDFIFAGYMYFREKTIKRIDSIK